jgi:TetR/AcrR family transcriptional regulator of autoinduction and epiphytic fitness
MTKDPTPTRSQLKHQAILEAAAAEFRAYGFQGTSMDRISERAQVSKRTVYNHFSSKDDLFRAILADFWTRGLAATDIPFRSGIALEDQLAEIARAEMDLLAQEGFFELARALMAASMQAPELAAPTIEELMKLDTGVVAWVREAVDDGALSVEDAEMAGHQFKALIKAFAFWPQVMMGRPPLSEIEAEAVISSAIGVFLAAYRA